MERYEDYAWSSCCTQTYNVVIGLLSWSSGRCLPNRIVIFRISGPHTPQDYYLLSITIDSFVKQIVISGIRIVNYESERHVLYVCLTSELTSFGLYVICSQLFWSCVR